MTDQLPGPSIFEFSPGEPYEFLDERRASCPVYLDPVLNGYLLTRFDDVEEVMTDAARFRLQIPTQDGYQEHHSKGRAGTFRRLLGARELQGDKKATDTLVAPEANWLIDTFVADGKVELVSAFANPFPARIIGSLFGLDPADYDDLLAYKDARIALFNAIPGTPEAAAAKVVSDEWQMKIDGRMQQLIDLRRQEPADDLTSLLLTLEEDGQPISDEQIIQIVSRDILLAGSETVTHSLASAVYRLLTVEGMYEQVRNDLSLVPQFVEEALRFDPPAQLFWRAAEVDTEVRGCPIAKDSQIYTSLAAANRDGEVFSEPSTFDISRPKGKHLTFSKGTHRCPGAWLGRTELEVALTTLLERLPNLRFDPDGEAPQFVGLVTRSWQPLHLLFDA